MIMSMLLQLQAFRIIFFLQVLLLPQLSVPISFDYTRSFSGVPSSMCDKANSTFCLYGDAYVDEDSILQLTRENFSSIGMAVYSEPMLLRDSATGELTSFTTTFTFNITNIIFLMANGMSFFLSPYPFQPPLGFNGGGLGLVTASNPYNGTFVAVEFDTYRNSGWDPPAPHLGIDVNSIRSVANHSFKFREGNYYFGDARVDYNGVIKKMSVSLSVNNGTDGDTANLSYPVDFAGLPDHVVVGFTGATGTLFYLELNQLIAWSFNSTLQDSTAAPPPPAGQDPAAAPPPGQASTQGGKNSTQGRSSNSTSSKSNTTVIAAGIGVAIFVLIISGITCFILVRRRSRLLEDGKKEPEVEFYSEGDGEDDDAFDVGDEAFALEGGPRRLPLRVLAVATGSFDTRRKLGSGASGTVYRAFLEDLNRDVAVKRVRREDSRQRRKEFMAEARVISQLRHRHLLQLLGWCHEKGEFLLVYELMPNLSLDRHLFSIDRLLPWPLRYNIALQVASSLLYLHEEWIECIVHRDIKSSNILLDDAFNAKLGDFGVARLAKHGSGLQTTALCGTIGYMAPECLQTGKTSKESDVYAFGMVALELATGRMAVDPSAEEGEGRLVEWVWGLFEAGEVLAAADRRLEGNYNAGQMERLLVVGLWCAHPNVDHRATIRTAMAALNFEDVKIDLPLEMPVAIFTTPGKSTVVSSSTASGTSYSSSGPATSSS